MCLAYNGFQAEPDLKRSTTKQSQNAGFGTNANNYMINILPQPGKNQQRKILEYVDAVHTQKRLPIHLVCKISALNRIWVFFSRELENMCHFKCRSISRFNICRTQRTMRRMRTHIIRGLLIHTNICLNDSSLGLHHFSEWSSAMDQYRPPRLF